MTLPLVNKPSKIEYKGKSYDCIEIFKNYHVTACGMVFKQKPDGTPQKKKLTENNSGYLCCSLTFFHKSKRVYKTTEVHRLVCLAWHPQDGYEFLEVDHIDGDKKNNHKDNLRWLTSGQNTLAYSLLKEKVLIKESKKHCRGQIHIGGMRGVTKPFDSKGELSRFLLKAAEDIVALPPNNPGAHINYLHEHFERVYPIRKNSPREYIERNTIKGNLDDL